jgi:nucleoside-diphosphate-sugar epimerase
MNKKKITIVGGAGFIGHNLALDLVDSNYEVSIIDSLSINNLLCSEFISRNTIYSKMLNKRLDLLNKNNIKLIIQDARNYHALSKELEKLDPDILIHLAAVSHANESNKNPYNTFDHSLRTLENSLDWAKSKKCQFIYLSSSMVYGDFNNENLDEEYNCKPIGIYGNLKLCGELMVKSYQQVFDLPYTIIRPSALYGERCISRRVGQIFIESALSNKPLQISGNGEDKLDFTYIKDLTKGIMLCCNNEKAFNQIFNITYGNARKIIELTEIMKEYFNNLSIIKIERDKLMPERGTLDNSKAKELINFSPNFPLEIGYNTYIKWYIDFWKKNYQII